MQRATVYSLRIVSHFIAVGNVMCPLGVCTVHELSGEVSAAIVVLSICMNPDTASRRGHLYGQMTVNSLKIDFGGVIGIPEL